MLCDEFYGDPGVIFGTQKLFKSWCIFYISIFFTLSSLFISGTILCPYHDNLLKEWHFKSLNDNSISSISLSSEVMPFSIFHFITSVAVAEVPTLVFCTFLKSKRRAVTDNQHYFHVMLELQGQLQIHTKLDSCHLYHWKWVHPWLSNCSWGKPLNNCSIKNKKAVFLSHGEFVYRCCFVSWLITLLLLETMQ